MEDIFISNFVFFSIITIFLKILNYHIITAQTTNFENIQYDKIYFPCSLVCGKTSFNKFTLFFWKIFLFQISFFSEMPIFVKFSNCRIVTAQTTNFETIQYDKTYFSCSLVCCKTSYNKFAFFLEDIPISNFDFIQK